MTFQRSSMADRYTPPTMDWESPGDVYRRFKLFKTKVRINIFDGPLEKVPEGKSSIPTILDRRQRPGNNLGVTTTTA